MFDEMWDDRLNLSLSCDGKDMMELLEGVMTAVKMTMNFI